MNAGSIASNPTKLKILNLLAKKELELDKMAKNIRIPLKVMKGLVEELERDGFVERVDKVCRITEKGIKALKSLKT